MVRLLVALGLALCAEACLASGTFKLLGLYNGSSVHATGISQDGSVVIGSLLDQVGAVVYTGGKWVSLGNGTQFSNGCSDNGALIVGDPGFYWVGGVLTPFWNRASGGSYFGEAVTGDGRQAAGYFQKTNSSFTQALLISTDGRFTVTLLPLPAQSDTSAALAVSDNGSIVAGYVNAGASHLPATWTSAGVKTYSIDSSTNAEIDYMNKAGNVFAGNLLDAGADFVMTATSTSIVDAPNGGAAPVPFGLDDAGDELVGTYFPAAGGDFSGYLWTPKGGTVDFADFLSTFGITPTAPIEEVDGVSGDGLTFTGTCLVSGKREPFVATVNNNSVLSNFTVDANSVVGGNPVNGAATLQSPAQITTRVLLSSSSTALATVPAFTTISSGATSSTFPITTFGVAGTQSVVIKATLNGATKTQTIVLSAASLSSLSLSANSVIGGNPLTGTVTLNGGAGPSGDTLALSSSDPSAASVPSAIAIPANAHATSFTVTTWGLATAANATLSATLNGVTKSADLAVNPATFTSLGATPATVVGGNSSLGTVALNGYAPSGGVEIFLSTSNTKLAVVTGAVIIAAQTRTKSFPIATFGVDSSTQATVYARQGSVVKSAAVTLQPASLSAFSLSPASIVGGNPVQGTVKLTGFAGPTGVAVILNCNTPFTTGPATVTVPYNHFSATFAIVTKGVAASTVETLSAQRGATTLQASETLLPAGLLSIVPSSASVVGGNSFTLTIRLNGNAGPGGLAVSLSSSSTLVPVPGSVIFTNGSYARSVTVNTPIVSSNLQVTFTATYKGVSKQTVVTITP